MTPQEIKEKIDANNIMIQDLITPNQFTLNNVVSNLLHENALLQKECKHEFKDGHCIYCYKEETK